MRSLQNPVLDVAIGSNFCCILDENRNVFALGDNSAGQLGIGHVQESRKPVLIEFLKEKKIRKIFAGHDFTFALGEDKISSLLSNRVKRTKDSLSSKCSPKNNNYRDDRQSIDRYFREQYLGDENMYTN